MSPGRCETCSQSFQCRGPLQPAPNLANNVNVNSRHSLPCQFGYKKTKKSRNCGTVQRRPQASDQVCHLSMTLLPGCCFRCLASALVLQNR